MDSGENFHTNGRRIRGDLYVQEENDICNI